MGGSMGDSIGGSRGAGAERESSEKKKVVAETRAPEPARPAKPAATPPADEDLPATTKAESPASGAPAAGPFDHAEFARDIIRAAETQLAAKDADGARRILVNGLGRVRGTPSYGHVVLRLAQLDFAERRFGDAARHAKAAAETPDFTRRNEAILLAQRAEREAGVETGSGPDGTVKARAAPAQAADEVDAEPAEAAQ
jgi:hypothetical protein